MRLKQKLYFAISLLIIFIAFSIWLMFYALLFSYVEENKAIEYSNYILGIPLTITFLFLILRNLSISIARDGFKPLKFLKELISYAFILGFIYVPLRPVVSSWIVFLNSNLGEPAEIRINGIVKYKQEYIRKSRDIELHIFDLGSQKMLELDVDKESGNKYEIGRPFNVTLNRGIFGLLYRK